MDRTLDALIMEAQMAIVQGEVIFQIGFIRVKMALKEDTQYYRMTTIGEKTRDFWNLRRFDLMEILEFSFVILLTAVVFVILSVMRQISVLAEWVSRLVNDLVDSILGLSMVRIVLSFYRSFMGIR